ncbi:nucleotidyltransferase domain-containing protein [Streptomyces thinghirensis]|nr:nucleotidyltransferase domain-containing protein [Streptomyces thinghirensis]
MDLVTHDLRKFVRLMLRRNGYVLEQLLSPLVVHTTEAHRELAAPRRASSLATTPTTTGVSRPLSGGCSRRPGELEAAAAHLFRVLLTGIHLMRGGEVQPHSAHAPRGGRRRPGTTCPS